jgi:hypothetical protein
MRPFFICLSIALGFNINPMVMAQNASASVQGLIQNMQLKKSDIESMINMLAASGQITPEQANAAKDRLAEMNESEVKGLTMEALSNLHGAKPINVDLPQNEATQRKPASLPTSPFMGNNFNQNPEEVEIERKKVEEVQKDLLKNAFDIKKFQ